MNLIISQRTVIFLRAGIFSLLKNTNHCYHGSNLSNQSGGWNFKLEYIISKGIILAKFTLNWNSFSQPFFHKRVIAFLGTGNCLPALTLSSCSARGNEVQDSPKRIPRNLPKQASTGNLGELPRGRTDYLSLLFLFRAAPVAYGSSQARGRIRAVASGLCHNHSNARSKPHLWTALQLAAMPRSLTCWMRPGIEPTSSRML